MITNVRITSAIDAKRNSVTSCSIVTFIPGGICFWASAKAVFTSSAIWVAFEPATWLTIPNTAGWPLLRMATEYCKPPNSTLATSRKCKVWPFVLLEIIILPYSSGVFKRPLYRMVYSNLSLLCSPKEPGAASIFCSANAPEISEGTRPYCFILSGRSQIRIE